jgi:ATP-dependent Zn protease
MLRIDEVLINGMTGSVVLKYDAEEHDAFHTKFTRYFSSSNGRSAVLLGGRAAEQALFGDDVSMGAADDLQSATEIALEIVTRHGMDPTVGQRTYAPPQQPFLSGAGDNAI